MFCVRQAPTSGSFALVEFLRTWYQQAVDAGCQLGPGAFKELLDAALKRNDVRAAAFWYNKSLADGSSWPTEVFNQLLSRAAQLEGYSFAARLFADLGDGLTPTVETFNSMMLAAAKKGDAAAAEIWYARAQSAGCIPDQVTYQALINAASKNGDLAAAERWLRQATDAQLAPTLTMLNSLMAAAAREGDVQLAIRWFQRMEGLGLKPDVVSYTTIISAAAKTGNLSLAETWFEAALTNGITPNVVTFTSLIDAAVRTDDEEAARHWYESALEAGVRPSIRTFNTLMSGPARKGDLASTEKWFRTASFSGTKPDRVTYNTLLGTRPPRNGRWASQRLMNAAARAGDLASAEEWFRSAVAARAWFQRAADAGIRPNVAMYNAMLSAAAKDAPSSAEKWLWAERAGQKHDAVTFRTLLNAAAKQGDMEAAEKWYSKAVKLNRQLDTNTFNSLLQAAIRCSGIGEIRRWYDRLLQAGCAPDEQTFSISVFSAARARNFSMMGEWLREAASQGFEPEQIARSVMAKEVAQRAENPIPEEMAKSLRVMERIVSQNVFHRQHMIYRNYPTLEDLDSALNDAAAAAADPVNAGVVEAEMDMGEDGDDLIEEVPEEQDVDKPALQDLFCFDAPQLTQGMTVTCAEWNSNNKDLLAVSYGDTAPVPINPGGLVLFWSLKNPTYPERVIRTRQGVWDLRPVWIQSLKTLPKTMGKFTIDPSLEAKMHQYQIVGRAAPTNKNPTPKSGIYRMRIFARNVVLAKSRFWYFMKRLNKAKKSGGELLAVNELHDTSPTKVKNYGIWLRYDSRTNTHNMYKEYRNININGAVGQLRWPAVTVLTLDPFRSFTLQRCRTRTVLAVVCSFRRPEQLRMHGDRLKFPIVRKVPHTIKKLRTTFKAKRASTFVR
eukprot:g24207.t1